MIGIDAAALKFCRDESNGIALHPGGFGISEVTDTGGLAVIAIRDVRAATHLRFCWLANVDVAILEVCVATWLNFINVDIFCYVLDQENNILQ